MLQLEVTGMTCGGCAKAVEGIIKAADRQAAVTVDVATGRVDARTSANADAVVRAIEAAGFGAKVRTSPV